MGDLPLLSTKVFHQRHRNRLRAAAKGSSPSGRRTSNASTSISGGGKNARRGITSTSDIQADSLVEDRLTTTNLEIPLVSKGEFFREQSKHVHAELVAEAEFLYRIKNMVSNQLNRLQTERAILSRNVDAMIESSIPPAAATSSLSLLPPQETHAWLADAAVFNGLQDLLPGDEDGKDVNEEGVAEETDDAYLKALAEMKSFLASRGSEFR